MFQQEIIIFGVSNQKCVSLPRNITQCGVKMGFRKLKVTENFCYYPPPPPNVLWSRRSRKNSGKYPPPTESRRLLENTETKSATTPSPTEWRRLLEIPGKFCYYPPPPSKPRRLLENTETLSYYPPLNRVDFWRSRKRLKKFNKLNLAAVHYPKINPRFSPPN